MSQIVTAEAKIANNLKSIPKKESSKTISRNKIMSIRNKKEVDQFDVQYEKQL